MKHSHYKKKFCTFCKTNWTLLLIPLVHNRNHLSIMASHLHSKEWCTTSISGKYSSWWYCFPGVQEVRSLLGLPQCSAGCRLGFCSCLWLCTTIWWWQSGGFSSTELRSKPRWCNCASLPVPAWLCQPDCDSSQGWAERSTGSPRAAASGRGSSSQGGNLWDRAVLESSCLRGCPTPGPRSCQDLLRWH